VVGMMVRDEDVTKMIQRHASGQELSGSAVSTVYDVGNVVN